MQWDYRHFTIEQLEGIIDSCQVRAKSYNVTLCKKGSNGKCFGIIKEHDEIIFLKEYKHKYDFVNKAHIFMDFHFALEYIAKVSIKTRNDRNRRFGDIKSELRLNYNLYGIK